MKKINQLVLLASLSGVLASQAQNTPVTADQPTTSSSDNAAQAAARAALLGATNQAPATAVTDATNAVTAVPAPVNVSTDAPAASVAVADTNAIAAVATNATAVADTNAIAAVGTNVTAVADTNATMVATNANTASPTTNVAATATDAVAPSNTVTTTAAEPTAAATTPAPVKPGGIPLIQFSDVPLTTAIENLARQAGLNYMLDPKIAYGQPDASGQIKAEPTLSIRWENITAENALLALLDNYGLQMINDQKTGIGRITIKDPSAPPALITRVLQLKYSSVSNMVAAVQSTFTDKRSKVIADTRTSQMVVVATEPEQLAVDSMTSQLDTPTKQVLIETKLVEISSNPTSRKGIDWTGTLEAQHVQFGNNSTFIVQPTAPTPGTTTTVNGVSQTVGAAPAQPGIVNGVLASPAVIASTTGGFETPAFLNADGVSAVLSFLNSSSDAQIVSTPRVVTLDNETANIAVTRGYPVFNVTASTANTSGGSSVGYTNVGTILNVTPRISANDKIWLKVSPQVSSFAGVSSQTVGGVTFQADLFDYRSFDTQVLIPNAHTLVMGGLVQDNPISSTTKVPLLGDIPYLGYAFRSETKSVTKDNLLIFITPTIVKDDDFHAADTQFFNSEPVKRPLMLNPNSMWDGAQPYNWSNPANTDPAQKIIDEPSVQ
jgi:type II secretory pathway component GspD/PulD (secretin)